MDVDAMQSREPASEPQHAVQEAAALERVRRDVEIRLREDREPRQDCVAMVPLPVDRVAPVRNLVPHGIGDELVLRLARPVPVAAGVAAMGPLYLLQE